MRNGFLCLMAPELVQVSGQHIDTLTEQAGRVGRGRPRARHRDCSARRSSDMRHAPDPRVLLDVAAVQLTADSVAPDLGALLARLHRLEEQVAAGVTVAAPGTDGRRRRPPVAVTGRAALGGRARTAAAHDTVAPGPRSSRRPRPRNRLRPSRPPPPATVSPAVAADRVRQPSRPLAGSRRTSGSRPCVRPCAGWPGRCTRRPPWSEPPTARSRSRSRTSSHREKCEQHRDGRRGCHSRPRRDAPVVVQLLVEGEAADVPPTPCRRTGRAAAPSRPCRPIRTSAIRHAPIRHADRRADLARRRSGRGRPIDEPIDDDDVDLDDLVDVPPESRQVADRPARRGLSGLRADRRADLTWRAPTPPPVQTLIDELGRLPGIGPKSAQRIAFHLLKMPDRRRRPPGPRAHRRQGAGAVLRPLLQHRRGPRCVRSATTTPATRRSCASSRSRATSSPSRSTGEFRGRYHVLLGAMSPLEGIGPEQLKIRELLARIEPEGITEVIICTNPNTEGEVTAMYLARLLKPLGLDDHPDRQRPAGRRRPRVRRRAHARPSARRPSRRWTDRRSVPTKERRPKSEAGNGEK